MSPFKWFAAAGAVCAREFRKVLSSPSETAICWIMPFVWMLVTWGLLGTGMMDGLPVAVVDEDHSHMSRQITLDMAAMRSMNLQSFADTTSAMDSLRRGETYAVIVIPRNYARDMISGAGQSIVVYLDQTRYAAAGTVKAEMTTFMSDLAKASLEKSALYTGVGVTGAKYKISIIEADLYSMGNPQSSFIGFLGSNLIPGVLQLGAALAFSAALIREAYNRSVLNWLAAARGSVSAAIVGKMVPTFIVFSVSFLVYIILFVAQGGFIPDGSIAIWFLSAMLLVLGMIGATLLFFAISPTWRLSVVVTCGYAAPALPFAGFSIPLDSMGHYVSAYAKILPITWFDQIQGQEWVLGSAPSQVAVPLLYLFAIFIVPTIVGTMLLWLRFRRLGPERLGDFMGAGK